MNSSASGRPRTKQVDVRVIAATQDDLEAAVAEGRFRADLSYRLSVYPIRLPSLQDRVDDIPRLVWFFIHRNQRELGRRDHEGPEGGDGGVADSRWPGNIRELENVVERAMIASSGARSSSTRRCSIDGAETQRRRNPGQTRGRPARTHRDGARAMRVADQRERAMPRSAQHPPEHAAIPRMKKVWSSCGRRNRQRGHSPATETSDAVARESTDD